MLRFAVIALACTQIQVATPTKVLPTRTPRVEQPSELTCRLFDKLLLNEGLKAEERVTLQRTANGEYIGRFFMIHVMVAHRLRPDPHSLRMSCTSGRSIHKLAGPLSCSLHSVDHSNSKVTATMRSSDDLYPKSWLEGTLQFNLGFAQAIHRAVQSRTPGKPLMELGCRESGTGS